MTWQIVLADVATWLVYIVGGRLVLLIGRIHCEKPGLWYSATASLSYCTCA
jgi:hypothetical protein